MRFDRHVAALLHGKRDAGHDEPGKEALRKLLREAKAAALHDITGDDVRREDRKQRDPRQQDHGPADEADRAIDDIGHGERAAPRHRFLLVGMGKGGDAGHGIRPGQP